MEKSLAVIINSFNRIDLLKESLPNIIKATSLLSLNCIIVVVDAGSTDGSLNYVNQYQLTCGNLILADYDKSKGVTFSEGCNLGVQTAFEKFPNLDYILLFETDNFFDNLQALPSALVLIANPAIASVGFTVEKFGGKKITFGNSKPSLLGFILGQTLSSKLGLEQVKQKWYKTEGLTTTPCDIIFTSPLLIKAAVWKEASGMDSENFPFSDSDADLCLLFLNAGYKNLVLQTNGVIHDNKNQTSAWSQKRVIDYHIAHSKLLLKHLGTPKHLFKLLMLIKYSIEFLAGKLLSKNNEYVKSRKFLFNYHYHN